MRPLLFLALFIHIPRQACGWGAGHDDIMRAVLERLPADLRATFTPDLVTRAVTRSSHYPDSFEPFDPAEIGEEAVAALLAAGVKVRYDLHHDHGRVAAFARLIDAFREGDPAHIVHWIASHSHVIADMAACNHDPLVHTATYGWAPWRVKLPHRGDFSEVARYLDLSGSARDPTGGAAAFSRAIEGMILSDDGRGPEDQAVELILYGQEGARYCAPRGVAVLRGAAAWVDHEDPDARAEGWENLGELGAWAVVRTLRDVAVARRFAEEGVDFNLSVSARDRAEASIDRILRERRLEEDAVFAPLLRAAQEGDQGLTGVAFEPAWDMNDAMLGFSSRVTSAAIARTLGKEGRPYATLDIRTLAEGGFPDPARIPRVVIVATAYRTYRWMNAESFDAGLTEYRSRGGRIVWITGTGRIPERAFADLIPSMHREERATLPLPGDRFVGATLSAKLPDEPRWTVLNTPDTPAGWQRPHCPWTFTDPEAAGHQRLLELSSGESHLVVGIVSADRGVALLPVYAVTPHLLDRDTPVAVPHEPELDGPARTLLLGTIDLLTP